MNRAPVPILRVLGALILPVAILAAYGSMVSASGNTFARRTSRHARSAGAYEEKSEHATRSGHRRHLVPEKGLEPSR